MSIRFVRLSISVVALGLLVLAGGPGPTEAQEDCRTAANPIVCENQKLGDPDSQWDIGGSGDPSIQGFATAFSVAPAEIQRFKIDTDSANYTIDIYRMGYYAGMGARRVATISPSAPLPQNQPACLTNSTTGLIDCGNWGVSASWTVPTDAVSGIYFAKLTRIDSGGSSHIFFVVRDDTGQSDLLFQTSDTTWQAYNSYGGNSLYVGAPAGRAYKVSYNRPFNTRDGSPEDFVFNAEYPMVRWLEANGFDVSYFSGGDTDRFGSELLEHNVFLSVGHDEYWSGGQRANVEAARAAGVNVAFFSGNEVFWKTRWESSIDGSGTPHRTLVSYKETHANTPIDPADPPTWTGTWRDARFSPPADGGRPEHSLTGTLFRVNDGATTSITVPAADGKHRFWRNTTVATLPVGGVATFPNGTLGYEWDEAPNDAFSPPRLMRLSTTTRSVGSLLLDNGSTYGAGTATHSLTLYRHPSGALVFGAGTVQWSWGLDSNHDRGSLAADVRMKQATVNLFADMGVQPDTLEGGLTPAIASNDVTAPTSIITSPASGASVSVGTNVTISGTASDAGGGIVGGVEVSVDGGTTWRRATGTTSWTLAWTPTQAGAVTIQSRAFDDTGNVETPSGGVGVTATAGPACPCTIYAPSAVPAQPDDFDASAVEIGTRFRSDVSGYATAIRFYKASTNTGTHTGRLWTNSGTLLATVTFTNETASGWQQANLASAIPITANTTYLVSYHAPNGHYTGMDSEFATSRDNPPLHGLKDGFDGPNGVYRYGSGGVFPSDTYLSEAYWVDVVFNTVPPPDSTAPTVTAVSPVNGSGGVDPATVVTATFSEAIDPATLTAATVGEGTPVPGTFELRDSANTLIRATVSYDTDTRVATLRPDASLALSTTFTAVVRGGTTDPRVKDLAGNALAANTQWSFTTAAAPPPPPTCPCSIWTPTAVPQKIDDGDTNSVELGTRFRSDVAGYVTGARFYKSSLNTGTHVAKLWSNAGSLLGSGTFTGETSSGWQEATFASPIAIAANTTYVISYHANNGHYSSANQYFATTGVDRPPLHALRDGVDGSNGVYLYGTSAFPTQTYQSEAYFIDVVFNTTIGPDTTPPVVTSVSPVAGRSGVRTDTSVTATFNEAMTASTITSSTVLLRDSANGAVTASVSYASSTKTATLVPSAPLAYSTTYTAIVKGGATDPRVKDTAGNALAADYTWSLTTAAPPPPPPTEGPGGPVLVITSATNPFTSYMAEILRTEGLNAFATADVSTVSAATLSGYDVALLGEMPLTAAQVSMFETWVNGGGNLMAMRPDKQLTGLMGLTDAAATLSNGYLLVNTASGPGVGIVDQTIQFHGLADRYTLNGATAVATLYSSATTATANPAVTLRAVGTNGGHAVAFSYDLARSIVYTRQGNPAWSGQERDAQPPIRSDDLYFGARSGDLQPDWVDLNKVAIPQADEQQRLLWNILLQINASRKPLPRFWYFPRMLKAVVIMTGDDHANGGTAGRFDHYLSLSAPGCSVADWNCIRGTSYMFPGTPLTDAQITNYLAQGFELGLHLNTGCADYTPSTLANFYSTQLSQFATDYPQVPTPTTHRTHCIAWSDYATQPQIEWDNGIRFDTNYYYWPGSWVLDRPGMFTGSGLPMRFATSAGAMIDVYQAATQMTDESGMSYALHADTLLDRALGPEGYFGAFTANMHTDFNPSEGSVGSDAIIASAQSRSVPVISASQMLEWLDGRNGSSFRSITWSSNLLGFEIAVGAGANGLHAMVPTAAGGASITGITVNGTTVPYTIQTIKGVSYAVFAAQSGPYQVSYGVDAAPPLISSVSASGATGIVQWTTDEPSDSRVAYGTDPANLSLSESNPALVMSHSITLSNLAPGTTYYYRVSSTDTAGNAATSPATGNPPASFTTAPPDTIPPTVTSVTPATGATGVAPGAAVTATFSEAMNAATITSSTVVLRDPFNVVVAGTVNYNAGTRVATLTPSQTLASSVTYTARVIGGSAGVTDVAGNPLASDHVWSFTVAPGTGPASIGQWAAPFDLPVVAVHQTLLPTGKVMMWDAGDFTSEPPTLWEPSTGLLTFAPQNNTDLFCSGHTMLADGRLLTVGGDTRTTGLGVNDVNEFNAFTATWTPLPKMAFKRWYPTAITLSDGRAFVLSGYDDCNEPECLVAPVEIFEPVAKQWSTLPASANYIVPSYPFLFELADGRVLSAGSYEGTIDTRVLNLTTNTWSVVDPTTIDAGSAVMYAPGKIMKAGKWANADPPYGPSHANTWVLDMNQPTPAWRQTAPMNFPRAYHGLTLLPDGTTIAMGGGRVTDPTARSEAVLETEIWSPVTETWTVGARMQNERLYHGSSMLLPDGRVLVAGSGRYGSFDQLNGEVFSPPYLFKGSRPVISSAPALVEPGSVFAVGTSNSDIVAVTMVRIGSMTHSFNSDQRFLSLSFSQTESGLSVNGPASAGIAPPGYYLLFLINSNGVPSVGSFVRVPAPSELPDTTPPLITGVAASAASTAATITWTTNEASDSRVDYGTDPAALSLTASNGSLVTSHSVTLPGLASSTTYYYRVSSADAAGNLASSPAAPDPPASFTTITPTVSVADASVVEGNSGTVNSTFVISLSTASTQVVTVDYATANGSATAGSDYAATSGTLSFAPGETSKPIAVAVLGDTLSEADEAFTVTLTNPVNAVVADGVATGSITNDDPVPTLSIGDVSVTEGNSGVVNAVFDVTMSGASGSTVTVAFATAPGTAAAAADYVTTSGSLSFAPGVTAQTITVPVVGDQLNEIDEQFVVNLSGAVNASIADGHGSGTIGDDDPVPSISIADLSVTEGNSGTKLAGFALTLSAASGRTVTVAYATANGTATAGSDYVASSGTATFSPGTTSVTVNVTINGDTLSEPDETFVVDLTAPSNASITRAQATGTITNDEGLPAITISNATVSEGNSGSVNAVLTVTLSPASAQTVTVAYASANSSATAGSDYTAVSGTVTFTPGITSQPITIPVTGDTVVEANETFVVNLTAPVNATVSDSQGVVTITNDDVPPPGTGLVAAYGFGEGAGTTTADASGSGNTGSLSGATWSTQGKNGNALSFDGVNDAVVVADSAALDVTRVTMMAWVRPTTLGSSRTVLIKETSTGQAYALYARGDTAPPAASIVTGGVDRIAVGTTQLPVNTWTHLAASYNGSSLRLYVNGTLVRTLSTTGNIVVSAQVLRIGGNAIWGEWFAGIIDDVRVYNRALTQAEIQTDMNTPITPP